jgi:hypothetical protein
MPIGGGPLDPTVPVQRRHSRISWFVVALATLAGCGGPETQPPPPPVTTTQPPVVVAADAAPPVSPRVALAAALAAKGFTVDNTHPDETLVCNGTDGGCVCLVDLGCDGPSCMTLDENLDIFRDALGAKGNVRVTCELADTGRLCDGSYFRFEGDIYRFEDRYFGPDGRLIGQRNATDYPEYCHRRAMFQYAGTIPDCATPPTDVQILCSDKHHERPLRNPMEILLWNLTR